jgi:hypothetical protein
MKTEKSCPSGQIFNPVSSRCVKLSGRIGKSLLRKQGKCPKGRIINPESGRCVFVNGRIGKKIVQQDAAKTGYLNKTFYIIFKPGLSVLFDSAFYNERSKASAINQNIWKQLSIKNYLIWYNHFSQDISEMFEKDGLQFIGFSKYSKTTLQLKCKVIQPLQTDIAATDAVQFALSPDIDEEHTVVYNNVIHLVEKTEIKKIFFV